MAGLIFNSTNLVILIMVVAVCVMLWLPFIRGRKIEAVVDGYCHPKSGKDKDLMWCYRFMYKDRKGGPRLYCYSNREYDTKEEMRKYPKGAKVLIRYNDKGSNDSTAVIISDNDDTKRNMMYTLAIIAGGIILLIGNVIVTYIGTLG